MKYVVAQLDARPSWTVLRLANGLYVRYAEFDSKCNAEFTAKTLNDNDVEVRS